MPMIMIQLISLAMMVFVVCNPDSTIVRIMFWLPLFTPHLMMNRAAADPPVIDVVGTTIVLFLSIVFVLWLSSKVFRGRFGRSRCLSTMHALLGQQIQENAFYIKLFATVRAISHRHVDRKTSVDNHVDPHHRINAAPIFKQHPDCHNIHRQSPEADSETSPRSDDAAQIPPKFHWIRGSESFLIGLLKFRHSLESALVKLLRNLPRSIPELNQ